jgi:hypothetical protein
MFRLQDDWGRIQGNYPSLREAMNACKGKGDGRWVRTDDATTHAWIMQTVQRRAGFFMIENLNDY